MRVPPSLIRSHERSRSAATTSGTRSGQRDASATVRATSYSCSGCSCLRNRSSSPVGTRSTVDQGRSWIVSIAPVGSTPCAASHSWTSLADLRQRIAARRVYRSTRESIKQSATRDQLRGGGAGVYHRGGG